MGSASIEDEKNGCFNGERFSNLTIALNGVGINSYIEKKDGIKNGQFLVMIDEDTAIGSLIRYKKNENGQIVEDEIKGISMQKSDDFVPCPKVESAECEQTNGQKCEL